MDINECYKLVQLIANKEQSGFISPDDFNTAMDAAQMEFFNDRYGQPSSYQPGRPKPLVGYPQSEKISNDLRPFLTTVVIQDGSKMPEDFMYAVAFLNHQTGAPAKFFEDRTEMEEALNSKILEANNDNLYVSVGSRYTGTSADIASGQEGRGAFVVRPSFISVPGDHHYNVERYSQVKLIYLRRPNRPFWNYILNANGRPVYSKHSGISPNIIDPEGIMPPMPHKYSWSMDGVYSGNPSHQGQAVRLNSGGWNLSSQLTTDPSGHIVTNNQPGTNNGGPVVNNWSTGCIGFREDKNGLRPFKMGHYYLLEWEVIDPGFSNDTIGPMGIADEGTSNPILLKGPDDLEFREVVTTDHVGWDCRYHQTGYRRVMFKANGGYGNTYVDDGSDASILKEGRYQILFHQNFNGGGCGTAQVWAGSGTTSCPGDVFDLHPDGCRVVNNEIMRTQMGFYVYAHGIKIGGLQAYECKTGSTNLEFRPQCHLEIIFRALGYLGIHLSEQALAQYAEAKQTITPGV